MQKLQDSVFSIVKTTSLSPAVFSFLQPSEDNSDRTPLGKILKDTKRAWLALGSKFCVIDLKTGLKIAARNFGSPYSHSQLSVTSVVELPTPLTNNSQQLIISLQCDDGTGMICVFHINGSQILRCIQTEVIITELAVSDGIPDGVFTCFDGVIMAGTKNGEIVVFDLNRASLIQALKDLSQGYEHLVQGEQNPANLTFLPLNALHHLEEQRDLAIENDHHVAVLLNENSLVDGQYLFRNPDGSICMKAKRDQIRVTVLYYIPQLASLAVGYNFGAFQIWNMLNTELEFTSQVNVECLPVTHFGFQEPCDDPRAFCYLWVIFSVLDRFEEEEFPLAVMYSLTYQGKRMLSETKCLYQEFSMATLRFQLDLGSMEDNVPAVGGKCVSCHTYSVNSTLGSEGEDSMLNICQLVWECWGENANASSQYGMLLFDLDQWYKDQMPATCQLASSPFMSATPVPELAAGSTLDARLDAASVAPYSHATRLEEHFYPNSLQYECICLTTSEACVLSTPGIQRQIISSLEAGGPAALLHPARLYRACLSAGLTPLLADAYNTNPTPEEQRRFLLSVCLEARLVRVLRRAAIDWATPTHAAAGCTLTFLVDWCWTRAIELKENAKELTAPLFVSSALPDRNIVRTLEHCVQQLTQLTGLLDAILTKCCNLVVPDALSEIEEKYKGIGTVALYFQVVQWFLRVGLLPERCDAYVALPYPAMQLYTVYNKRRLKLQRLQENTPADDKVNKPCPLLYIDQLIENEFGGDRIRQMWVRGGSECNGLYPPPSLYSLLRLYLLPDIAEEHKHSLVLYLLVDYSMVYDEVRYEEVIRRLMQFPTMFGLSNTAIKATQAFWHLDHRDFDFALDQLQCLTGNSLSEWQHNVVLSSLLAQKKMQAALQYLHVRKPAPIQTVMRDKDGNMSLACSGADLDDWQSCCNLYLARQLIFEALDVVRMCVHNVGTKEEKEQALIYFFKGCRNTGQLAKILQVSLLPFEEDVFIKYLQDCNEPQTSDILIMYYLQQARYLEAEQYNNKLKQSRPKTKDTVTSMESIVEMLDREGARDTLVDVVCGSLPTITNTVARCAMTERNYDSHIVKPRPMSLFVKATSPKNTFTYKSSFIQDTIQNASETWVNRPTMRRGIKRALNIEETPFICTPKLSRTRSVFTDQISESTPPKLRKVDSGTSRTPAVGSGIRVSSELSRQMAELLDMPEIHTPQSKLFARDGAETPHSILKIRREGMDREAPSPTDSRYLNDSEEELETASNHTHYSDSKHLRFAIPTTSESGSTPSPPVTSTATLQDDLARERDTPSVKEKEMDVSIDEFTTTETHTMNESHILESPPKKLATEERVMTRKIYKDTVRARRSLSISANSSLSDDPNTSIESIADIPITLINPRYSGEKRRMEPPEPMDLKETQDTENKEVKEMDNTTDITPKTPKGRRGIRVSAEKTPTLSRSRQGTPERIGSPVASLLTHRSTRSRTPERSPRSSPLAPIPEQPKQEVESEQHAQRTLLSMPRQLRSRSRTPERIEKSVKDSPRLEPITESPIKASNTESDSSSPSRRSLRSRSRTPEVETTDIAIGCSPRSLRSRSRTPEVEIAPEPTITPSPRSLRSRSRTPEVEIASEPAIAPSPRSLRSRSRTPEVEIVPEPTIAPSPRSLRSRSRTPEVEINPEPATPSSPRSLRSRAKTPEKIMSPKIEHSAKGKKSLSRLVLEANAFAKTKLKLDTNEPEQTTEDKSDNAMECTPMKTLKQIPSLLDVTLSPIVNKSILQSSTDSILFETSNKDAKTDKSTAELGLKSLPAFTTIHETYIEKSVLCSYQSSIGEASETTQDIKEVEVTHEVSTNIDLKSLPAFTTINEIDFDKSVLHSYESSVGECSQSMQKDDEPMTALENVMKPLSSFSSITKDQFNKPVLGSTESSLAETSQEPSLSKKSKNYTSESELAKTNWKDMSSLMTSDSDIDMKEDKETKNKVESQDNAAVIQKEKERIVEIEREINEIEGDMSEDDSTNEDSVSSDDEEIIEAEESEEEDTDSSAEESESGSDDEIISIKDTSEDSSTSSNKIQVDEELSTDAKQNEEIQLQADEPVETIIKVVVERDIDSNTKVDTVSTDPLNQPHSSMLTDDNSKEKSEQSDLNLNYSDEKLEEAVQPETREIVDDGQKPEMTKEHSSIITEANSEQPKATTEEIMEIDTVVVEKPKKAEIEVHMKTVKVVVDEPKEEVLMDTVKEVAVKPNPFEKVDPMDAVTMVVEETDKEVPTQITAILAEETKKSEIQVPMETEDEQPVRINIVIEETATTNIEKTETANPQPTVQITDAVDFGASKEVPIVSRVVEIEVKTTDDDNKKTEEPQEKLIQSRKRTKSTSSNKSNLEPEVEKKEIEVKTTDEDNDNKKTDEPQEKPIQSRKRTKSTSSNKSNLEQEVEEKKEAEEIKTPSRRKRTQSTASNKSTTEIEQNTPENKDTGLDEGTPSRRRAKTPTSTDMRRIMTRRASKEMSEKLDESKEFDDKILNTPKRRSTRSSSKTEKKDNDNESVVSDASIKSTRSKASEDVGDAKPATVRKGRKSILSTKIDLSVIPETIAEESETKSSEDIVTEYASSRRLTRHQKAILESWLEPSPSASPSNKLRTRRSSALSTASTHSRDDDDASTHSEISDVQPIDRISLLNKTDFEGSPDHDEYHATGSPDSMSTDTTKELRARLGRAASESRSMPKAAKITRRISIDIAATPELGSPVADSPARGRRASFNRACEALHTPKSRRSSTDVRKGEGDSPQSPARSETEAVTPSRRPRRASTHSNTSQTKSETGKRSKKP